MLAWALKKILGTSHEREVKKLKPLVEEVNKLEDKISKLTDPELKGKTAELKQKLENGATLDDILVEAFAVCREAGKRALRMRHYDVQLIGGMVLHKGMIAEMRTGEGKTLVATLACYLNALEGKGVHVVTVNDYLARRDSEWMGKLYGFLGLSTGVVVNSQADKEKRDAYRSDITYGQNNEFGFDYLRDNMKFSALDYNQKELNYAIVDEVDSILIDEARTPLIISGQAETSSAKYKSINEIIPRLRKDEHYVVDEKQHSVSLTDEGVDMAQKLLAVSNLYDPVNLESLHILNQCLRSHTLYKRDVNYLVTDEGKVLIIDEFTGRVLAGRRWSDGLHQAVEAKELVPIQEETRTMATITFQNLFRIYKKLSGMTGTADTEAEEFHKTYKLSVVTIPTNKPIRRQDYEDLVYKTEREKFTAVVNEILDAHDKGRPVLVGTTSVEKSTAIAKILKKKGIPHAVLNAKQHEKEAYVVAQAGRKGAITVSTNMAGRGTDIVLGGSPEMLAKLEFKEQGRDEIAEKDEFDKVILKYEGSCKKEGDEVRKTQQKCPQCSKVFGADVDKCDVDGKALDPFGGLHIVGTERHESRRIDNQLRGRAGRQGDPGSSKFFLSLEDDLMRIFAGDKVKSLMERMGMPDDEPIEHPWVTKSILDAQSKVEGRNFDIRKNLLEYDDVMNEQRKTVYKIRQQLLLGIYTAEVMDEQGKATGKLRKIEPLERLGADVKQAIIDMLIHHGASMPLPGNAGEEVKRPKKVEEIEEIFDMEQLRSDVYQFWGYRFDFKDGEGKHPQKIYDRLMEEIPASLTQQRERLLDLTDAIVSAIVDESCPANKPPEDWDWKGIKTGFSEHFESKVGSEIESLHDVADLANVLYTQALSILEEREKEMGTELLMRVFRHFYLEDIDKQWVEHLTNMEHLRDGIGLRGYGQRDPKQEYKKEGYDLFVNMMAAVSSNVVTKVMRVRLQKESEIERLEREDYERHQKAAQSLQLRHGGELAEGEEEQPSAPPPRRQPSVAPVKREQPKIDRNDLCPCGSGEKFKKCHGAALEEEGSDDAQA